MPLNILFVINIADATQKGGSLFIADVFHAMGLQAGYINHIAGTAHRFFDNFIRLRIILVTFEAAAEDVHGLVIKMIMDGDLTAGLSGKKPQTVIRITGAVISML